MMCMHTWVCIDVHACVYLYIRIMYALVYARVCVCVCTNICMSIHEFILCVFGRVLQRFGPARKIRIW